MRRDATWPRLAAAIAQWGRELGFQEIGIADTELSEAEEHLQRWLAAGRHGDMAYMARHGTARVAPGGARARHVRVISARMNYWPRTRHAHDDARRSGARLRRRATRSAATTTRCCARASRSSSIASPQEVGPFGYRVFTDSAPVLEVALAAKAGLGWRGKHTLLLTREAGSYFFLGEIYTDLPLPATPPATAHCGTCTRVHRRVPDRRHRRAVRARRAALHLLPDDRASRRDSRGRCVR